jgi:hypothetical protein
LWKCNKAAVRMRSHVSIHKCPDRPTTFDLAARLFLHLLRL